jgi:hypothetical protein
MMKIIDEVTPKVNYILFNMFYSYNESNEQINKLNSIISQFLTITTLIIRSKYH